MMGGGPRGMLGQEVSKPVNASATLLRLVKYFRPYWIVMIIVAGLIIGFVVLAGYWGAHRENADHS